MRKYDIIRWILEYFGKCAHIFQQLKGDTDENLMLAILMRKFMLNEERCREVYEEYWALIRYLAKKKGVPYDYLEDICQEVFAAFFKMYGKYLDTWNEKQVKAALVKIVGNKVVDYYRRNSSKKELACYEDDEVATKASPNSEEEDTMLRLELVAVISYMDTMQPISKLIAKGFFLEGFTVDELSTETGMAKSAIRMRISRIRQDIRGKFKEESHEKKNN